MNTEATAVKPKLRLLHFDHASIHDESQINLENDPLESMLQGVELSSEIPRRSPSLMVVESEEGLRAEKQIKHLRYYLNEIALHFQLDE